MSHSIEPFTQRFGGDERNYRTALSGELRLSSNTSVSATVDPDKGQALVKLGGCHIHGVLDDLEVAGAAFTFVIAALSGHTSPTTEDDDAPTKATVCTSCAVTHSRKEPCATVGSDRSLRKAYERMAKTHMITPRAAGLFVDAAMMFVQRGDLAAAKMLLHHFVVDDVAYEVVDILNRVHQAGDAPAAWIPPPTGDDWSYPPGHPSADPSSR